jgi:hypothetical protein
MIHDNQYMEKEKEKEKKMLSVSVHHKGITKSHGGGMKEKKIKGLQRNSSIEVNYCLLNSADKKNDTFQTHISQ